MRFTVPPTADKRQKHHKDSHKGTFTVILSEVQRNGRFHTYTTAPSTGKSRH